MSSLHLFNELLGQKLAATQGYWGILQLYYSMPVETGQKEREISSTEVLENHFNGNKMMCFFSKAAETLREKTNRRQRCENQYWVFKPLATCFSY